VLLREKSMNIDEAQQIFDGVMLSDGGLRRPRKCTHNSYFYLNQSFGPQHLDWIINVKEALTLVGFEFSSRTPYVEPAPGIDRKNAYVSLWSKYSKLATFHYNRWYTNQGKILPVDLQLTSITLANWFMGDGSSSAVTQNLVNVKIATCNFTQEEVSALVASLRALGIDATWNISARRYPVIYMNTIDAVNAFMNLVDSHVLPSFKYKIKRSERINDYSHWPRCNG